MDTLEFARRGVYEAFWELMDGYGCFVYWYALLKCGQQELAVEITNQAFLEVYPLLPQFTEKKRFIKFLFIIASRVSAQRQSAIPSCPPSESRNILNLIRNLPENYQLPLVFVYGENKALREISELFNLAEEEVTMLLENR